MPNSQTGVVMINLNKRQLKKALQKKMREYQFESGIEAEFYVVNGVGLKFYEDKYSADFAYETQKLAAEHWLGPKVFNKINIKGIGFGFITEIADTSIEDYWEEDSEEYETLSEELNNIGIFHGDLHGGNIGTINGKIVCIDFGPVSTSN
jgi:hypothetical protein